MDVKEKKAQDRQKLRRVKSSSIVNAVIYSSLSIGLVAAIMLAPRFEKTTVVVRDGEPVNGLVVRDIVVIPGEAVSYEVNLFSYVPSDYTISVDFQGDGNNPINDYIVTSIESGRLSYEAKVGDVVNQGFQKIGNKQFDWFRHVSLSITYRFSEEITEDVTSPFSLQLRLKVDHKRR